MIFEGPWSWSWPPTASPGESGRPTRLKKPEEQKPDELVRHNAVPNLRPGSGHVRRMVDFHESQIQQVSGGAARRLESTGLDATGSPSVQTSGSDDEEPEVTWSRNYQARCEKRRRAKQVVRNCMRRWKARKERRQAEQVVRNGMGRWKARKERRRARMMMTKLPSGYKVLGPTRKPLGQ